jgi:hypothetical protein
MELLLKELPNIVFRSPLTPMRARHVVSGKRKRQQFKTARFVNSTQADPVHPRSNGYSMAFSMRGQAPTARIVRCVDVPDRADT